jgi:hypothetical protein
METQNGPIDMLVERAEQFGKTSIELYRLKAIGGSADVISSLIAKLAVVIFFTLFFLIMNIGIALWIGTELQSFSTGFFIVGGFYGIGWVLLFLFSGRWIKKPVRNSIITQALN